MYLSHFGLDEPPFRITPHIDFFFAGANRGATLEALLYAITHDEGIVKVSGEVGSGKTMLCRVLMERLPEHVDTILLSNPSVSREEILHAIADDLKLDLGAERQTMLLRVLQEHLIDLYGQNRRVVVLIDEAHAMPQETLEQIRLLSNLETGRSKLLQIVLFGQPELDDHLGMPHMRQLKERITHSFRLEPMVRSDIEEYIEFRMRAAGYRGPNVFTPAALRKIVKASEGLTRRINILADKSLLAAFADNTHTITAKHAGRAIRDSEFYKPGLSRNKIGLAAGGVVAGLALGLAAHFALTPVSPPAVPIRAAPIAVAPAPVEATASVPNVAPAPVDAAQTARTPPTATVSQTAPAGTQTIAPAANPATPAPASPVTQSVAPQTLAKSPAQVIPPSSPAPAVAPAPVQPQAAQKVNAAPAPPATQAAASGMVVPATPRVAPVAAAPIAPVATPTPASRANPAPPQSAQNAPPAFSSSAVSAGKVAPASAAAVADDTPSQATANAKPGSRDYVPPPPPGGKLTRERFAATQTWLKTAPANHYAVQLLTADTRDLRRLEELLLRAPGRQFDLADFHVYGVRINDRQHYRIAYGLYPSLADVNQAIRDLPPDYKKLAPYHRTVERMRSQNRQ